MLALVKTWTRKFPPSFVWLKVAPSVVHHRRLSIPTRTVLNPVTPAVVAAPPCAEARRWVVQWLRRFRGVIDGGCGHIVEVPICWGYELRRFC